MKPWDYVVAARVPRSLEPQSFGCWTIQRLEAGGQLLNPIEAALHRQSVGFDDYTLLRHLTWKTLHLPHAGEVVMDDSALELRKHLPIWLAARGRVLVTGLGLGCVVRGLLANRDVDSIEVVELDRNIARIIGREFAGNQRVNITIGDALEIDEDVLPGRFDFAWHDLWSEDDGLARLHTQLFIKFKNCCGRQGAWDFPRSIARLFAQKSKFQLLGAPRYV